MKACIIIPFYFGKRRHRTKINYLPFGSVSDVLDLARYTVDNYKKLDPGLDTDIIIINNSPGEKESSEYLSSINNTTAKRGKFIVVDGDNIGISFGAHNKAFHLFKNQYNLWCFTEDDVIFNKENFLLAASKHLLSDKNIGFVAAIGVTGNGRDGNTHAHGGIGCALTESLNKIIKNNKVLPHANSVANLNDNNHFKKNHIINGEIPFTNIYTKIGLRLERLKIDTKPFIRWDGKDSPGGNRIDVMEWGSTESVINNG